MKAKTFMMATALLTVFSGGGLSVQAKTRMVKKISHVKITKHSVTGYTTKYAHIKLIGLKHGEKANTKSNKHGKFVLKVKRNNLKKLNFKLKATKKGYKVRNYKYKVKKKKSSVAKIHGQQQPNEKEHIVITTTNPPAKVTPSIPAVTHKPSRNTAQQIADLRIKLELAKQKYTETYLRIQPILNSLNEVEKQRGMLKANMSDARIQLVSAKMKREKLTPKDPEYSSLTEKIQSAQADLDAATKAYYNFVEKNKQQIMEYEKDQKILYTSSDEARYFASQLQELQPGLPLDDDDFDLDLPPEAFPKSIEK